LKVARLTGLEPATPGVTGRYSNQLSYNRTFPAPDRIPSVEAYYASLSAPSSADAKENADPRKSLPNPEEIIAPNRTPRQFIRRGAPIALVKISPPEASDLSGLAPE
jgi:hypothetical protein